MHNVQKTEVTVEIHTGLYDLPSAAAPDAKNWRSTRLRLPATTIGWSTPLTTLTLWAVATERRQAQHPAAARLAKSAEQQLADENLTTFNSSHNKRCRHYLNLSSITLKGMITPMKSSNMDLFTAKIVQAVGHSIGCAIISSSSCVIASDDFGSNVRSSFDSCSTCFWWQCMYTSSMKPTSKSFKHFVRSVSN